MVLMEQRVRELEKDNAELEELLDLLPAVKDWERKLERKASALRHELKRVQARPLVPLSSLHLRTDGNGAPVVTVVGGEEWDLDGSFAAAHNRRGPEGGVAAWRSVSPGAAGGFGERRHGADVGDLEDGEEERMEAENRVGGDRVPLQWLAEQNLKMRGEIVNLEETKVRAIRRTVAMRVRLAAYDAALHEAGVTQETRYLLGLEIDKALGTAGAFLA